ncbi:MFS transporter [Heyndrickxia coagulans]|uniref:MFS transporter n=1 Tax=Heyndrickxia coagulans TaxID=1398 RepID=UPI00047DBB5F|nr:aromatic acid/H+ symport family MFS transporter [Heyndrickxia coagulans]
MNSVNIHAFIDKQRFNRFHLLLVVTCMFIIICDGYDMFMFGTILPSLMKEWKINAVVAGNLSSYALIGMMLGALIFGPVADRIGRKKVILLCTAIFTIITFTSGFANGPVSFGWQRFLAGIGLGGVMPNLIALVTEYAPKKLRSTLVAVMFSGHALGGVVASLGALFLLPHFSWRAVVWMSIIPLFLIPLFIKFLPESFTYYVRTNKNEELAKTLNRVNPHEKFSPGQTFHIHAADDPSTSFTKLFVEKRAFSTIMFWIAAFMCLLVMYGLSTWLPKIMQASGFPVGSSLLFLITLNLGAVTGAIFGGKLADRFGSRTVLITFFIAGFAALTVLGFKPGMLLLYILLFIAGGTTTGTQIICNAYISQYYPSGIRSTGVGWALGIGRVGGIIGPTLGGLLMNSGLSVQTNFLVFAVLCLISAVAIWLVQEKYGQLSSMNRTGHNPDGINVEDGVV